MKAVVFAGRAALCVAVLAAARQELKLLDARDKISVAEKPEKLESAIEAALSD